MGLSILNRWASGAAHDAIAARRYPLVLYGTRLPISEGTTVQSGTVGSKADRHLVLAFSETCPYCRRNRVNWEKLLSLPNWPSNADVWLIAVSGGLGPYRDLIALARKHSIPLRVLSIRDQLVFPVQTGLESVPATVIVDAVERVRFARIGEMAPSDAAAFEAALQSE